MDNYSKCLWIVEQLYRNKSMSFRDLAKQWCASSLFDGRQLSNSTFRRRKNEIAERMNVNIIYDATCNTYKIANAAEIANNAVYQYLLGTFHISSLTSLAQKHRDKVQLQAPPTGVELLYTILEAIDRGKSLIFKYKSYYTPPDVVYDYELIPCFVRLFEGRWYLIAQYLDKSKVRVLAMERISELQIGGRDCKADEEINAQEYYAHCYGIIRDDQAPQTIRLKFIAPQDAYINSKPLHESQKIVELGEGYTVYEYFMRPSYDLTQAILWQGDKVEVLSPKSYRKEMMEKLKSINYCY